MCHENELVIDVWSPIHLRDMLKKFYWKEGKETAGAMAFWEDSQRYFYLPRLKTRKTLEQAIIKGAGSNDFFGTAYGQTEGVFEGFKLGDANVQLNDTLLLIEPETARQYEAKIAIMTSITPIDGGQSAEPRLGTPIGSTPVQPPINERPPVPVPVITKARAFYGSVEVKSATAKVRLLQLAEEIISVLASDPQTVLKITVEINADFPSGAADQIKRAVSENAKSLGFKSATWE